MTIHKATQFAVDSSGAYLTELTDSAGEPILFARQRIGEKLRGGSHVCYPYFGPDTAGVLAQHGFGRQVEWRTEVLAEGRRVQCSYDEAEDTLFSGLQAALVYELNEAGNCLASTLTIVNQSEAPRAYMPGFHPYFAIDPSEVRSEWRAD